MPFWKAGKNDDQVLDELKETQKQNADEFVKKQEHADEAQKSSLIIDNNFTPVEYDPQYILQVNHLKKYFPIKGGMVSKTVGYVKAVDGVTFNLKRGTTMGLVGESGCGKTTTGRTILRLYDSKSGGQVLFNGQEVYDLSHKELRALRTKMQIIFQDPFSSLSPRMPVGEIIGEAVREHNLVPKNEFNDYIDQVMDDSPSTRTATRTSSPAASASVSASRVRSRSTPSSSSATSRSPHSTCPSRRRSSTC